MSGRSFRNTIRETHYSSESRLVLYESVTLEIPRLWVVKPIAFVLRPKGE